MPLFVSKYRQAALGLLATAYLLPAGAVLAQPMDVAGVISICAPVISEQYDGDKDRWGTCMTAVTEFLDAIGAASVPTDPTVTDLVVALTELYRDDDSCRLNETELPEAIAIAAGRVTDDDQAAQILEISVTISECQQFATAAIVAQASPF